MNKNRTYTLLIILVGVLYSCKKDQPETQVPIVPQPPVSVGYNFSFESWTAVSLDGLIYEEPSGDYWTSLNYLARLSCPVTVTKTADAQNGQFAAQLETKQWGSMVIPGLLVLGSFIPQEPFIIQGKPFIDKPISVDGFYKYFPVDGDTCVLYARLTKFNQLLNKQDTIAEASLTVNNTIAQYAPFKLLFDYRDVLSIPDSLTILFVSSIDGANFRGHPGSKLFIDNISINYQPAKK